MGERIECPKCKGAMIAGMGICPHTDCGIHIVEYMDFMRALIVQEDLSIEEKKNWQQKLIELEKYY